MLKGIPTILNPDILKILMEMGHGDEIVISDGNFQATSLAKRLVRLDGNTILQVLDELLKFFPLDTDVDYPVVLMKVDKEKIATPVIWEEYKRIIKKYEKDFKEFQMIERFEFYERTKKAYAVIYTGEKAIYANIILKKGVVIE